MSTEVASTNMSVKQTTQYYQLKAGVNRKGENLHNHTYMVKNDQGSKLSNDALKVPSNNK